MSKVEKIKYSWGKIAYTLGAVILLCAVIMAIITNVYRYSEEVAFETLHLETQQIKNDINLQILSDRENLVTMARLASRLYEDGEDFDIMFQSFKEIGLIENIGILLPDNTFLTRIGEFDVSESMVFDEEVKKGTYVSGRIKDITGSDRDIIRSAVPITSENKIVAILYGVTNLETMKERYIDDVKKLRSLLIVIEGGSGNYIINTNRNKLGDVSSLAPVVYGDGYSFEKLLKDLQKGQNGYTSFIPQNMNELCYVHYAPLQVADWQIMLAMPQSIVLESARTTGRYLYIMLAWVIFIMFLYILFIFASDRRRLKTSVYASWVRKRLLEVNKRVESFNYALESVASFAGSRSAFYIDTQGEDYSYIVPSQKSKLLTGEDRAYFISKLLQYASNCRKEHGTDVYLVEISADKKMEKDFSEFYEFLLNHGMKKVFFAVIVSDNSNMSVLGVVNHKTKDIRAFLKDISVCFSMTIHNKKYLSKTVSMALTDSLTGVKNRMAYNQDLKVLKKKNSSNLVCIYIDVNELHYFNNQYGHASGDQMLVYISDVLKEQFGKEYLYRMGGDEFLVFVENCTDETLNEKIENANVKIQEMKYHIAMGVKRGDKNHEIEGIVNLAEKDMYQDKARYYQSKSMNKFSDVLDEKVKTMETGDAELNVCLDVMGERYHGIYGVSLSDDKATQIVAPGKYFSIDNEKERFSDIFKHYIHNIAKPEYHRILLQLLDYELLKDRLLRGEKPSVSYTKVDGEKVILTVCLVSDAKGNCDKTVWFFEKEKADI